MNTPELSGDEYIPDLPSIHQLYSPFHLDPRHLAQGVSSVFISLNLGLDFTSPKPADVAWTGDPPIILQLNSQSSGQLLISLGVCTRSDLPVASPQQVAHWAYVIYLKGSSSSENQQQQLIDGLKVGHNCSTDHISSWSGHSRTFTYEGSIGSIVPQGFQITLSFTTFESDPERTLVPHLHAEYVRAVPNDHEVLHHESHTGTAVDEPVIFEPPDMEQSQNGLSGDRSGWPPESQSRSKTRKFLDGLRARWNSGWSRVATRHWRQKHTGTALERYPVEVETEVVRGAE